MPAIIKASNREIIGQFIQIVRTDLIKAQADKKLLASGKSAAMLTENFPDENTGQIIDGSGSFYYQEHGRNPSGDKSKDYALTAFIYDWLPYAKKYGFNITNDTQRLSISFAISKKINRLGTYTYRSGQVTGVLSDVVTPDKITSVGSVFAEKYAVEVLSDIVDEFKK